MKGRCLSHRHPRLSRLGCLVLAMLLSLAALSCNREPIVESDLNFLSADGYSIYTVVYSEENATQEVIEAAQTLRDSLEIILDCEVGLTNDHVSQGTDYTYEILVGEVDRTVVPGILSTLERDEYTARVTEHKIVLLGADNRATVEAVRYFMKDVMGCDGTESAKQNVYLTISHSYRHNDFRPVPKTPVMKTDTVLPVSPYLPEELLVMDMPTRACDALTMATLQGLAACMSGEQILFRTDDMQPYEDLLRAPLPDGYCATVYETDAQGKAWTAASLLAHYAPSLRGYILCANDLSSESAQVAVSMAHQLMAVVVNPENRALAEQAGLPCIFDATEATMTWFYGSDYFKQIDRTVAVEQSPQLAPRLIDYAVMSGALVVTYSGEDPYLHAQMFRYLDEGAVVIGSNDQMGEYQAVKTLSAVNVCYLPAQQTSNLSTLSGFTRRTVTSLTANAAGSTQVSGDVTEQGYHTVCLMITDGENMDWMTDDFLTSPSWYASDVRGKFAMNWGIPALLCELNNPVLTYLNRTKTDRDDFVVQFSGVGATFLSLWSGGAVDAMAKNLAALMTDSGVSYLQVTDQGRINPELIRPLAEQSAVKGIFYTDYQYQNLTGEIHWIDDTPIVAARYRLMSGLHDGSLEYVAESINSASTDPSSPKSYSLVVVNAWSGLDASGRLVAGGNTMDAVAALVAGFDENVRVVGADEFMRSIREHLTPSDSSDDGK